MKKDWDILYETALKQLKHTEIPPFIKTGQNACCLLTKDSNAYVGVNVDSTTSLNGCAEKNAMITMLNNGEHTITKIVIINELEELITPCQSCVENLIELSPENGSVEVLMDIKNYKTIKIEDLLPSWWGTYKQKKK